MKTVFSTTIIYQTENGTQHFFLHCPLSESTATPSFTVSNLFCVKYFFMLFSHVAVARLIDTVSVKLIAAVLLYGLRKNI